MTPSTLENTSPEAWKRSCESEGNSKTHSRRFPTSQPVEYIVEFVPGGVMQEYKYLIVGGGMAADAAVGGIREADSGGSIGLIGAEHDRPYNRPPLSKGLWKGEAPDSIWRETEKQNVNFHLGRIAKSLDRARKTVTDDEG